MKYLFFGMALLLLAACSESKTDNGADNATETKSESKTVDAAITTASGDLKNGITVEEKGLKVTKAMLLTADGTAINDDNTVGIGDEILCRLFVSGWQVTNGKVKLGAGQTIETEEGNLVLDEPDLFSDIESANAEDAGIVTLKATITELKKSIKTFVVGFRVWDKVSNAEVKGEYTFHLK